MIGENKKVCEVDAVIVVEIILTIKPYFSIDLAEVIYSSMK